MVCYTLLGSDANAQRKITKNGRILLDQKTLQYFVRTPEGEEHGPYDREALTQLFAEETFGYDCQVRNSLMKRWRDAEHVAFLKPIVAPLRKRDEEAREQQAVNKLKKRMSASKPSQSTPVEQLHSQNVFSFTPAPAGLRLMAGLLDILLVMLVALVIYTLMAAAIAYGGVGATAAFYTGVALFAVTVELMLAWSLGFHAQTPGQQFWGIMLVRMRGQPVFLFRAFCFVVIALPLGILTPLLTYILPARRAVPDIITRTRIVRIRVVGSDCWTVPR